MKSIVEYISENLNEAKDVFSKDFTVDDVHEILSGLKIDKKYEIDNDEEDIIITLDGKVKNFVNIMSALEEEIKDRKLGLELYVTGDETKSKPEIYVTKY